MTKSCAAVLMLTSMLLYGCGGGSSSTTTPTKPSTTSQQTSAASSSSAALIAKGDEVCAHVNAAITAHPLLKFTELPRLAALLGAEENAGATELEALTPPASLAADWKKIVADAHTIGEDTLKIAKFGTVRDPARKHALLVAGAPARAQLRALATRDGFHDCSHLD